MFILLLFDDFSLFWARACNRGAFIKTKPRPVIRDFRAARLLKLFVADSLFDVTMV